MTTTTLAEVEAGDHVRLGRGSVDWEVVAIAEVGTPRRKVAYLRSGLSGKHRSDVPIHELLIVKKGTPA